MESLVRSGPASIAATAPRRFGRLSRALGLAAPHPALWAITAAIVGVDLLWLTLSPVSLELMGVGITAGLLAGLLAASAFWTLVKPEPTLRAMAQSSAFLCAFTSAAGVLHYLAATLAPPLFDTQLAAAEAALGFDWPAHAALLNAHPWLGEALAVAYHSSAPQVALVVVVLSAMRRFARLRAFLTLFALTLLAVIVLSSVFPAAGAYAHYAPAEASAPSLSTIGGIWHLNDFEVLRAGAAKTIALQDIRGLATFPSFHVCLAMLTAWALGRVPVLGPLAVLVNAAVIVGTLGAGGHYLPDVLAGGVVGVVALSGQGLAWRRSAVRGSTGQHRSSAGASLAARIPAQSQS
ncbi:MAG: phosphatase PAP2 family protein [Pseudomonadota bacterium]|nr:phosphatase PAP2 family protein [Pseudomonadota bacterium]